MELSLDYSSAIESVKSTISKRKDYEKQVSILQKSLLEMQTEYVRMSNAKKILSAVSDENTQKTLNFVTGMVNKVLLELFPKEPYRVALENKLYQGNKPHIVLDLYDCKGHLLDTGTQTGDGIKQVICFMYAICLIELRKGRRLMILDERLNGLHKTAKKCIASIMEVLARGGFQFLFVEYGLNDFGKIYNVERTVYPDGGGVSELKALDGSSYDDEMVYVGDVDLSALDEDYVEEELEG